MITAIAQICNSTIYPCPNASTMGGGCNKRKRGNTAVDSRRKTKSGEPMPKIDGSTEGYKLDDLSCTICLELLDEPVASESKHVMAHQSSLI